MIICGIDFETTCEKASTTRVTEIGAILFCEKNGKIDRYTTLTHEEDYPPQSEKNIEFTHITDEMLKRDGVSPKVALEKLISMIKKADYCFAHKKAFDETVFKASCARYGLEVPSTPWICTLTEVPYPDKYRCKQLSHLALDHKVKMDGRELHRAINDVDLMLDLVMPNYPLDQVLKYALSPDVYLYADILGPWLGDGGDGGIGKAQAQELGYAWEKARGTLEPAFAKRWVKKVKLCNLKSEVEKAPFPVALTPSHQKASINEIEAAMQD